MRPRACASRISSRVGCARLGGWSRSAARLGVPASPILAAALFLLLRGAPRRWLPDEVSVCWARAPGAARDNARTTAARLFIGLSSSENPKWPPLQALPDFAARRALRAALLRPGAGGPFQELRAGRQRSGRLLDPQACADVVIEAEEHSLQPLDALLDGELLPLRTLAGIGLQRQLALLQLEVLDDEDDRDREPEDRQDADDGDERGEHFRGHGTGKRTRPGPISRARGRTKGRRRCLRRPSGPCPNHT